MPNRFLGRLGCLSLLAFLFFTGLFAVYFTNSRAWLALLIPAILAILLLFVAALPGKRKITPQQWADELEKYLLGTEGSFGWDDATSIGFSDERLENLRCRLIPHFDLVDTPEKREEFLRIIETLRRGEIP
jgi:hypothetical protein